MKKLILAVLVVGLFITSGIEPIRATTALYNASARIVNASGFVINGTASATTASYNFTAQIVSSTGTVLNPGTPSGVSATPNMTIRIVDSNGFVQDTLGGGAAANPAFTTGNTIATATNPVVTAGSTTNGDFCINVGAGGSAAPTTPLKWWQLATQSAYSAGAANWLYGHTITTDEAASTTWSGLGGPVCQVCYSHTIGALDLVATNSSGAGTSTATCPAITTVTNNDLVACLCVATNGAGTVTWGSPSAGTLREHIDQVSGTTRGCAADDLVQATAGTVASHTFTMSAVIDWDCVRVAIQQR